MAQPEVGQRDQATDRPPPVTFSALNLPARDLATSTRFYTEVLGGRVESGGPGARIQFANFAISLGEQDGGATGADSEHPHYAFTVPADNFAALRERLQAFGVPTHDPWTRAGSACSLMYFRDPSGNQFEMYCPEGDTGIPLRIGHRAGGDYVIPFRTLVYGDLGQPANAPPAVSMLGFDHMTLPSKDLGESKRFLTTVFGGIVTIDGPSHVTVMVGGAAIGNGGPLDSGWTALDAHYPRYTFEVAPEHLVTLKERLGNQGVPTSDVGAHTGADAFFYFRDPTGNLWELSCTQGFTGATRRTRAAGGNYTVDVRALMYEHWRDPGA
ncbi:MAG TPA: VOC family protein [Chloroflexota bacterium]|jgi:catechol 2,3-dioxygenase-like lactoylglutathione lyase family enzyme